jgi:outer membrane protein TolC
VRAATPFLILSVAVIACGTAGRANAQGQPSASSAPAGMSPFLRGVPSGTLTPDALSLSITDAIGRALEHNLGVLMAEEGVDHARGVRWTALSGLLPDVNGRLAETRQKINLEAFGFPLPAGIPSLVGPFNVFDARVYLSQSILDLHAINDARAERHNVAAAEYSSKSARDLVVLVAANAYLQALAASARVDSARAQLQTADALYQQAGDLKQAGIVAGLDVLRAQVQLNTERQRSTAARNDFEKAKLQLARLIGLPAGQTFTLSDQIPPVPIPDMTLESALERAYAARPDYQAALERLRAAEAARRAIIGEALPSLRVTADFGELGLTPSSAHGTFSMVGALNVPIFQGGRSQGRLIEADADLRNRRSEAEDLKAGIYYDVRSAFLDLQSTSEQLAVATSGRDLASEQLTQARDRFAAGVGASLDVVQAQEAVALANEQYIAAVYGYNVSKALLARGMGAAEEAIRQYLGGSR